MSAIAIDNDFDNTLTHAEIIISQDKEKHETTYVR